MAQFLTLNTIHMNLFTVLLTLFNHLEKFCVSFVSNFTWVLRASKDFQLLFPKRNCPQYPFWGDGCKQSVVWASVKMLNSKRKWDHSLLWVKMNVVNTLPHLLCGRQKVSNAILLNRKLSLPSVVVNCFIRLMRSLEWYPFDCVFPWGYSQSHNIY